MIQEILDASKLNFSFEKEAQDKIMMGPFVEKALSNIISNAVKYTKSSGRVNVYLNNRNNLY